MAGLFIILILLLVSGTYSIWLAARFEEPAINAFSAVIFIVVGGIVGEITSENTPTAIDVYRGKTSLEITYRDSIPVDTVVVFKKNSKCN